MRQISKGGLGGKKIVPKRDEKASPVTRRRGGWGERQERIKKGG